MKKTIAIMAFFVAAIVSYFGIAAGYRSQSFLQGTTLIYTATNTNTFYWQGYTTNVVFTNINGTATNPTSNVPWVVDCGVYADANGAVNANTSIGVDYSASGTMSALTFQFVRSDDGVTYDTNLNTFTFTLSPVPSATRAKFMTNVPSVFLTGAKNIRLNYAYTASNSTAGTVTLNGLTFNGFAP